MMKVHHVGYAVADIEKAIERFAVLGFVRRGGVVEDGLRHVRIAFVENGDERIELVAPNGDGNPIEGVLRRNGACPYHICYEVESIEEAAAELGKGWLMVQAPLEAPAIGGRRVAFLLNKEIGLVELVEEQG